MDKCEIEILESVRRERIERWTGVEDQIAAAVKTWPCTDFLYAHVVERLQVRRALMQALLATNKRDEECD